MTPRGDLTPEIWNETAQGILLGIRSLYEAGIYHEELALKEVMVVVQKHPALLSKETEAQARRLREDVRQAKEH